MLLIIFVLFLTASAREQPCKDIDSVDITKGKILNDGSIHEGVVFPPNYVYSKYVGGEWKTYGCLCKLKSCFQKCCPLGSVFSNRSCTENAELDGIANYGLKLYDGLNFLGQKSLEQTGFGLRFGKPGSSCYLEDPNWFIQKDGKLLVEITKGSATIYGPDQYCIDNFVWEDNRTEISALICFSAPPNQENHYQVSSTCMLISCFFIVLTVAVYAWLPELRNLHGMVLMAYLLCFLVGFAFMATMQIQIINNYMLKDMCTVFTFIIYFSLLSAFFWLNIMCYDIWWTFSGKRSMSRGPSSARARFGYYSTYAFGMPLFLTILLAALEFGLDNNIHQLLPRIRMQGCFLFGNSKLLYFYGPIVILCVANLVFFTLTALKISEIKKQTQVLNKKDKQRFSLYIKLFLVMGVNWILEVVSSFYPNANYIWKFTDAYNVLVGLIIFIIFVCKVKTLKMIKHRYRQQMGLPPLSRTQTTNTSVSTRTCSQSKDEIGMLSVNNRK